MRQFLSLPQHFSFFSQEKRGCGMNAEAVPNTPEMKSVEATLQTTPVAALQKIDDVTQNLSKVDKQKFIEAQKKIEQFKKSWEKTPPDTTPPIFAQNRTARTTSETSETSETPETAEAAETLEKRWKTAIEAALNTPPVNETLTGVITSDFLYKLLYAESTGDPRTGARDTTKAQGGFQMFGGAFESAKSQLPDKFQDWKNKSFDNFKADVQNSSPNLELQATLAIKYLEHLAKSQKEIFKSIDAQTSSDVDKNLQKQLVLFGSYHQGAGGFEKYFTDNGLTAAQKAEGLVHIHKFLTMSNTTIDKVFPNVTFDNLPELQVKTTPEQREFSPEKLEQQRKLNRKISHIMKVFPPTDKELSFLNDAHFDIQNRKTKLNEGLAKINEIKTKIAPNGIPAIETYLQKTQAQDERLKFIHSDTIKQELSDAIQVALNRSKKKGDLQGIRSRINRLTNPQDFTKATVPENLKKWHEGYLQAQELNKELASATTEAERELICNKIRSLCFPPYPADEARTFLKAPYREKLKTALGDNFSHIEKFSDKRLYSLLQVKEVTEQNINDLNEINLQLAQQNYLLGDLKEQILKEKPKHGFEFPNLSELPGWMQIAGTIAGVFALYKGMGKMKDNPKTTVFGILGLYYAYQNKESLGNFFGHDISLDSKGIFIKSQEKMTDTKTLEIFKNSQKEAVSLMPVSGVSALSFANEMQEQFNTEGVKENLNDKIQSQDSKFKAKEGSLFTKYMENLNKSPEKEHIQERMMYERLSVSEDSYMRGGYQLLDSLGKAVSQKKLGGEINATDIQAGIKALQNPDGEFAGKTVGQVLDYLREYTMELDSQKLKDAFALLKYGPWESTPKNDNFQKKWFGLENPAVANSELFAADEGEYAIDKGRAAFHHGKQQLCFFLGGEKMLFEKVTNTEEAKKILNLFQTEKLDMFQMPENETNKKNYKKQYDAIVKALGITNPLPKLSYSPSKDAILLLSASQSYGKEKQFAQKYLRIRNFLEASVRGVGYTFSLDAFDKPHTYEGISDEFLFLNSFIEDREKGILSSLYQEFEAKFKGNEVIMNTPYFLSEAAYIFQHAIRSVRYEKRDEEQAVIKATLAKNEALAQVQIAELQVNGNVEGAQAELTKAQEALTKAQEALTQAQDALEATHIAEVKKLTLFPEEKKDYSNMTQTEVMEMFETWREKVKTSPGLKKEIEHEKMLEKLWKEIAQGSLQNEFHLFSQIVDALLKYQYQIDEATDKQILNDFNANQQNSQTNKLLTQILLPRRREMFTAEINDIMKVVTNPQSTPSDKVIALFPLRDIAPYKDLYEGFKKSVTEEPAKKDLETRISELEKKEFKFEENNIDQLISALTVRITELEGKIPPGLSEEEKEELDFLKLYKAFLEKVKEGVATAPAPETSAAPAEGAVETSVNEQNLPLLLQKITTKVTSHNSRITEISNKWNPTPVELVESQNLLKENRNLKKILDIKNNTADIVKWHEETLKQTPKQTLEASLKEYAETFDAMQKLFSNKVTRIEKKAPGIVIVHCSEHKIEVNKKESLITPENPNQALNILSPLKKGWSYVIRNVSEDLLRRAEDFSNIFILNDDDDKSNYKDNKFFHFVERPFWSGSYWVKSDRFDRDKYQACFTKGRP
jgi:hypothetical protein